MRESINVLIVEDKHDDAVIMALQLDADDFQVSWQQVDTPQDFRSQLSADIDIVLADYTLPRFSALMVLDILKQSGLDIPFIVVTGSIDEETAVVCIKRGAVDYLLKDRLSRLGEAVRHAITERNLRRTQRKAEQSLIILGRAVETAISAVVITDLSGVVTFVNQAVLEMWQVVNEQDIVGNDLCKSLSLPCGSTPLVEDLQSRSHITGELESITRTGRVMTLQYAANQVVNQDGQLLCLMFTFINVTEQRQAQRLRLELDRERDLREMKSRFVSMLVHDFRNPLASLQAGLYLVDKYPDRWTPDQVKDKIRAALAQSHHINQLIDDVLMIGKMEQFSPEFSPENVELVAFCRMIFEAFKQSCDSPRHALSYSSQLADCFWYVDPVLLRRAILNLLSNAVKYSPEGGAVTLGLFIEDSSMVLRISDQGIGVPPEDQKRIFDGFHRARNVKSIQGTGLGLAIVKQVIDIHRGTIDCDSHLNKGTTFTIRIPQQGNTIPPNLMGYQDANRGM